MVFKQIKLIQIISTNILIMIHNKSSTEDHYKKVHMGGFFT